MKTEWKKCKLGEVASFQNGFAFKSKDFKSKGKYHIIRIKELKNGFVKFFDDTVKIQDLGTCIEEKFLVNKNDILFALTGDPINKNNPLSWVGRVAKYTYNDLALLNQRVAKLIPSETIDKDFIYYHFRCFDNFYSLASKATGSASQANISTKTIENEEIFLPPLPVQKKIAGILKSLDDKIELNRQISKNLEEQAQTIYENTFITNTQSSWKRGYLSDLIDVKYGKDHKKFSDGIYPVYGSGGIMRYIEKPLYSKESVLVPRKGTLNNVIYVNEPFWSVDTMFYTEMKRRHIAKFIFHFLKNKDLASLNAGSAVPSMTTNILNAMELPIPDDSTFLIFDNLVTPLYTKIQANEKQSLHLAQIRDTILPKLMSGEIEV